MGGAAAAVNFAIDSYDHNDRQLRFGVFMKSVSVVSCVATLAQERSVAKIVARAVSVVVPVVCAVAGDVAGIVVCVRCRCLSQDIDRCIGRRSLPVS